MEQRIATTRLRSGTEIAYALAGHGPRLVAKHWGLGSDVLADIFAPDADVVMIRVMRYSVRRSGIMAYAGLAHATFVVTALWAIACLRRRRG